jgi:hypothetical protein
MSGTRLKWRNIDIINLSQEHFQKHQAEESHRAMHGECWRGLAIEGWRLSLLRAFAASCLVWRASKHAREGTTR